MDNFASRVPADKQPHYWALDQLPADLKTRANLCTHKVDVCGKQQLDFCKDNELLILNGRAPGDSSGKVTFVGRGAGTLIDYHMASTWLASCCMQLAVLDMARGACRSGLRLQDAVTDPEAGVRAFTECISEAAADTFQLRRRQPLELMQRPPWFDEECRYAWREWKDAERSPIIVPFAALKLRNMYRAVRRRKQQQFMHQRMADIDKLALKNMAHLYRVFGWRRHSACPRALHSQHAHWQSKLGGRPEPRGIPELLTEDCPELLKSGPFSMMECLASLFTAVLNGRYPEQLSAGLITAVHKKGDKADLNNYRPITVIPVLAKLFASVLTRRLADWTESNNLRAPTQAGFWANRGTSDQLSILNYIVKKCLSQGKKLYCCFVDFEKAFDTVDREVLWAVLANIGARGRPASAPSTERHERLFAENSDSTVATYKQMRGFSAAYTVQPYIQQIRGYRLRKSMDSDPLQQPQAES
eukprot:jgi/Astpho2/5509/Aster-x1297